MKTLLSSHIKIPDNRQRRAFDAASLMELSDSIAKVGLLHPVVVRKDGDDHFLVAGERRLRALQYLWEMNQAVKCGEDEINKYFVPVLILAEMDHLESFEAELEENIRRTDLSWQERSLATSELYELRTLQAEKAGAPPPSIESISEEVRASGKGGSYTDTRNEILVSKHLDDPEVQKAKSTDEAIKILKRKEETKRNVDLGVSVGRTFGKHVHTLQQGDCLALMEAMIPEQFDIILTDPPYGINAQDFSDSGGRTVGAHFYDDSYSNWKDLMHNFLVEAYRVAKPLAHLYIFCDVDNFVELKDIAIDERWNVFRTPFIWHNPTAMRAPWPEKGPQRKWQMCLYAEKGGKQVHRLYPDVLTYKSDENLGHPAQKPVELYKDLLIRSGRPGDSILDPFCGSGTIFPACHELKMKAFGIEQDANAFGIVVKRIEELK